MTEFTTVSIDKLHNIKLQIIAEKNFSDKAKTLRKMINDNWKPEYDGDLEKRLNKGKD